MHKSPSGYIVMKKKCMFNKRERKNIHFKNVKQRLLIGLNNDNPESDIGVNIERPEKQNNQLLVLTSTESSE